MGAGMDVGKVVQPERQRDLDRLRSGNLSVSLPSKFRLRSGNASCANPDAKGLETTLQHEYVLIGAKHMIARDCGRQAEMSQK